MILLLVSSESLGLTNPLPYDLAGGDYILSQWNSGSPAGSYPANMAFWQKTSTSDPGIVVEMDADWICAYNLTSRSRIKGLGDRGFSFLNTAEAQAACTPSGYMGEAVLALNTLGRTAIKVTWISSTESFSPTSTRQYRIRLQYRVGTSGSFLDLADQAGNPVE